MQLTYSKDSLRAFLPLIYLVAIAGFWAFYYNSNNVLNDYGQAKFEWLFMLDGLLVLPVLCWFCVADKKAASIKAVVYLCLAILIGSIIIPEENKVIWSYLESGRFVILAMLLLFELTVVVTVYWAIRAGLNRAADPDDAIAAPVYKWLGSGLVAKIMCFEARMWSFLIFNKRIKQENYQGDLHFSYHRKDDIHGTALGFIWLIVFEIPIVHLLLHFIWSPFAANVVTGLTVFGLFYMIAEYRAMSCRPISINKKQLIIRMGLLNVYNLDIDNIGSIHLHSDYVPRKRGIKVFNLIANPNVCLHLKQAVNGVHSIYLGVDKPAVLMNSIKSLKMSS